MHFGYVRGLALVAVIATAVVCGAAQTSDEGGSQSFSEADAQKPLSMVADGLVGHDPEKFLSAFDAERMGNYRAFAQQVRTFFSLYENFRVHYRILSVNQSECVQKCVGNASVEFAVEGDDAQRQMPGVTRDGEMRVSFQSGGDGWRITEIDRGFFR
jgi:hypothetical protein